ncbi:hypothetical protein COLO4_30310 [Corchorus olitorius]|uniref:Uncharacterized protein n=1 Tax=Corchorus olitorius TaxID=93759 RepID=A0A1R3H930_9ROSI|nr:hypothetical protein COLO4_30310 [Corchorus olitorius]
MALSLAEPSVSSLSRQDALLPNHIEVIDLGEIVSLEGMGRSMGGDLMLGLVGTMW